MYVAGAKSLVAENPLVKQQLLILTRSRQRTPNLIPSERMLPGFIDNDVVRRLPAKH